MSDKTSSSTLPPLTAAATPGNAMYRIAQVITPFRSHPNHAHDANTVRVGLLCGSRLAVSVRCLSENQSRKVLRLCEFSTGVVQQVCNQAEYAVAEQAPEEAHSQMVARSRLSRRPTVPPLSHHGSLSA